LGIIEDWGLTIEELNEILASRPSLRGILVGFVAEYKLPKIWFLDRRIGRLERYDNHDRTKLGDFGFTYRGVPVTVQVKSLQSNSVRRTDSGYIGTFQCDASDGRPVKLPNGQTLETTCLLVGGFDLLAVNLFEFGQQWRFAFAKNADLPRSRSPKYTARQQKYLLATSMKVTWPLEFPFRDEPFALLEEIIREKHRVRHR
jgi:hypothetical protein